MKVLNIAAIGLLWISQCQGIALNPSTFGGVVASAGRLTNSIRETTAWKRISSSRRQSPIFFPRAMSAVQEFAATIRQEERLILQTKNGALKGKFVPFRSGASGGYYSFQGIRYGQAPIGERRFRQAMPENPWQGVRLALREGANCPHRNMILETYKGNEDCLFLNVYTPRIPDSNGNPKLPVMFWIHGGAFQLGSGNAFMYGPDYLVPEDVILVTINYRLGALGFLSAGPDAPGNAGLKDQVLALKWVQDNIKYFGGDPKKVTIFGQSAGAASVHYMMLSPSAQGLFHRAIAQSGVALNPWALAKRPKKRAFQLAEVLGFESNDTTKLIEYLRKVPAQMLVDAAPKTITTEDAKRNVGLAFVPSVEEVYTGNGEYDEPFITEHPLITLKRGNFSKVPFMTGYTSHEAMLLIRRLRKDKTLMSTYDREFERLVPNDLNISYGESDEVNEVAKKIRDFYLGNRKVTEKTAEEMINLLTDEMWVHGIVGSARLHASHNQNGNESNTYLYRFGYDGSLGLYKRLLAINRPGSCHGDELAYLFYFGLLNVKIDPTASEALTIKRLVKMWTNFAKFGNPTPEGKNDETLAVSWKPVESNMPLNYLDITARLESKQNPDIERLEFWDDIYMQYNGDLL